MKSTSKVCLTLSQEKLISQVNYNFGTGPCTKCGKVPEASIALKEGKGFIVRKCSFCNLTELDPIANALRILKNEKPGASHKCAFDPTHLYKVVAFCMKCGIWLCSECINNHFKKNTDHSVVLIKDYLDIFCNKHPDEINSYFCKDCKAHFCKECFAEHYFHNKICIYEFFSRKKKKVLKAFLEEQKEKYREYMKELDIQILIYDFLDEEDKINTEKLSEDIKDNCEGIFEFMDTLLDFPSPGVINYYNYKNYMNNLYSTILLRITKFSPNADIEDYLKNKLISFDKPKKVLIKGIASFKPHKYQIGELCLLSNGMLASSSRDGSIAIYNLLDQIIELRLIGHTNTVSTVTELPNKLLISGSYDNTVRIWEVKDKQYTCLQVLTEHTERVKKVIVITDKNFASCSDDQTIKIYSTSEPYDCVATLNEHTDHVTSILQLSNKKNFVSGSSGKDCRLILWNSETFKKERELEGIPCCSSNSLFEHKGKLLVGKRDGFSIINLEKFSLVKIVSDSDLGFVYSFCSLGENSVLFGSQNSYIGEYDFDSISIKNKTNKYHKGEILSMIHINENLIASSFQEGNVEVLLEY